MRCTELATLACLFFAGLLAGGEFVVCYGVRPSLRRLDATVQIPLRQAMIPRLRLLVPVVLFGALLSAVAAALTDASCLRACVHGAGVLVLLVFIAVTLGGTVPINRAARAWQPQSPPADWRAQLARWERLDIVRCWAALGAFALFLVASALP